MTHITDSNVGKGATVRVNIDKEGASGVKKNKKIKTTSDVLLAVTESCIFAMEDFCTQRFGAKALMYRASMISRFNLNGQARTTRNEVSL